MVEFEKETNSCLVSEWSTHVHTCTFLAYFVPIDLLPARYVLNAQMSSSAHCLKLNLASNKLKAVIGDANLQYP